MVLYIDGHNLIPKIPGMSLRQIDDEEHLIELLQEYSRISRKKVEVFFDRAAPGFNGDKTAGTILVHYISEKTTADEAIIRRVRGWGKRSKEITVVSSDHHVQNQVKALGAGMMTSDQFAREIVYLSQQSQPKNNKRDEPQPERPLSEKEIREWMDLFNSGPSEKYSK